MTMNDSPFTLEDAMKAADGIRQVCNEKRIEESESSTSSSSWQNTDSNDDRRYFPDKQIPPGAVEGIAAALLSGMVVFSPFRSAILRQAASGGGSSPGFRNLVDLIVTPVLAVGAAQVGLATASLAGSKIYLEEVANVPPTAASPMMDLICSEMLLIPKEKGLVFSQSQSWTNDVDGSAASTSSSSWDPRVQTLLSLSRAMETCRQRHQYRQNNEL